MKIAVLHHGIGFSEGRRSQRMISAKQWAAHAFRSVPVFQASFSTRARHLVVKHGSGKKHVCKQHFHQQYVYMFTLEFHDSCICCGKLQGYPVKSWSSKLLAHSLGHGSSWFMDHRTSLKIHHTVATDIFRLAPKKPCLWRAGSPMARLDNIGWPFLLGMTRDHDIFPEVEMNFETPHV